MRVCRPWSFRAVASACIALLHVLDAGQVCADLEPGAQAELQALGYVVYTNMDFIPGPDDDTVLVCTPPVSSQKYARHTSWLASLVKAS